MEHFPTDPHILLEAMKETSTLDMFESLVVFVLRKKLQETIVPLFMEQINHGDIGEIVVATENLYNSMCWFYEYIKPWHNAAALKHQLNQNLKACLKWCIHNKETECFAKLFAYSFQFHLRNEADDSMVENEVIVLEWKEQKETVSLSDFTLAIDKFNLMVQVWLVDLELMELLCHDSIMSILEVEVDRYIVKTCGGEYEKCWVGKSNHLKSWVVSQVLPWLQLVFDTTFDLVRWEEKLLYILYGSYTKLRISEMLSIITDYPESSPALQDLRFCLQHTRQRPALIKSLKQDITTRVLHPGVSTQNIITVYIAAVKALRELDLSGVVMEMVLEPCTTYLTQREDAVRMIMQGLLWDDGSNDLSVELIENISPDAPCGNEKATERPEDWMPDPREADPMKADKSSRTSDIVTLFIGMYGSKEKFIKEYQKLLSKRLLQTWYGDQNESSEIRNLELLKKRFGEEDMSKCAVMLKDIADSKRINTNIKDKLVPTETDLKVMIVSSEFWPEITNQQFELPSSLAGLFDSFKKGYENLKASRSITWMNGVGLVDVELEMEGRTLEFRVNPLQASIIHYFQEKDTWSLSELSDVLKIPPTILRRKMPFWIHHDVIRQTDADTYVTTEKYDSLPTSGSKTDNSKPTSSRFDVGDRFVNICVDDEDEEEKENSEEEKARAEKNEQVFWNYVQGMLKNLESLPLDRIHKLLQMFVMHDADIEIELPQLRNLLTAKVKEGLLTYEQGNFKLVRDPS